MDMIVMALTMCQLVYPNVWKCGEESKWTRDQTTIEKCHEVAQEKFVERYSGPGRRVKYRCYPANAAERARHWDIVCKHAPARCKHDES